MDILLKKANGALYPADDESGKYLFQCKEGVILKASISKPRNIQFHRKYWALINYAYDCWNPEIPEKWQGVEIEKNRDTFRKNIQIMAGYGFPVVNLKNEIRYESKSISFGSMSEEEFDKLYNAAINVLLKMVFKNYTRGDIDHVVEELLRFA